MFTTISRSMNVFNNKEVRIFYSCRRSLWRSKITVDISTRFNINYCNNNTCYDLAVILYILFTYKHVTFTSILL